MPLSAEVFKDERFRFMVKLDAQLESGQISRAQYLRALYLFMEKHKMDLGCSIELANAIVAEHKRKYFQAFAAERKPKLNLNTGPEMQTTMAAVQQVIESTGFQEVKKEFQESQTQRIQSGELPSTSGARRIQGTGSKTESKQYQFVDLDEEVKPKPYAHRNPREKSDSGGEVDQTRQQGFITAHDMLKPGQSSGKFKSPLLPAQNQNNATKKAAAPKLSADEPQFSPEVEEIIKNEKGQSLEPLLVERILMEILVGTGGVSWNQIAGLKNVKDALEEMIVLPFLNPDLFQGLLTPGKGLLLFGPPGNGKTMIGKCIAQKCDCTFFSISASSLTSKWIGEGEKMVRTLFTVARIKQPAVIFIDEIDSLLTQRSEGEHESSRRLKTEFLVRLDGLATVDDEKLLIIGATNRPWELDDAARRRFVRKIYVQLPDAAARKQLLKILLSKGKHSLSEEDFDQISERTNGYSCADITNLCKDAAMGPVRSKLKEEGIQHLQKAVPDDLRHIQLADFLVSLKRKKATVDDKELTVYENWNFKFGDVDNSL